MQIIVGDWPHLGKPGGFHTVLESIRVLVGITEFIQIGAQLLGVGHLAFALSAHRFPDGESLSRKRLDLGVLGDNGSALGDMPPTYPLLHDDVAFDPLQFGLDFGHGFLFGCLP
jgi:hypothetical protein